MIMELYFQHPTEKLKTAAILNSILCTLIIILLKRFLELKVEVEKKPNNKDCYM